MVRTKRAEQCKIQRTMTKRVSSMLLVLMAVFATACRVGPDFSPYGTHEALFSASKRALDEGQEGFAIAGFEKLILELSTRDTLLPFAHFHLGSAYVQQKSFLLAAQAYMRVPAIFPGDSLADDAMFRAADAYERIWTNPELDPTYGKAAQQTFEDLLSNYPDTPLREDVFRRLSSLDERFAAKEMETARFYLRISAFDSAIKYLSDLLENYPATNTAMEARLALVRAYKEINWQAEATEQCVILREMYPTDSAVRSVCGTPTSPVQPAAS